MTLTWMTNTTLDDIVTAMREAESIAILTHEKPDGDAIGSSLALARSLTRLNVTAIPCFVGAWSGRFDSIVGATRVLKLGDEPNFDRLPANPDLVLITDTGAWSQLSKLRAWLEPRTERTIVIDHHLRGDAGTARLRHIDSSVAAVCQTVAELCRRLLCLDSAAELPAPIAAPLYLGLATDTGWFRHSNVTPEALRLAANLLDAGADHAALYRQTEQMDRPCRLKLVGRAISSMALRANDAIAIIQLRREDLAHCGADQDDAGGLTDLLLTMAPVRVAVSLTEVAPTRTKISFRSKTGVGDEETIDVNRIAHELGGGGHAQAAGARLDVSVDEAMARVIAAIEPHLGGRP